MNNQIDATRQMGSSAFKKEINHLLHSRLHTESKEELHSGWNARDHALVMAMLLQRKGANPKIASGKCMYVQGPYLKYSSIGVGQEPDQAGGHSWVIDPQFGLIDVSPILEIRKHRFRAAFDGVYGRVWLPRGKDRVNVVVCADPVAYEREIDKAIHLTGQSTAVYMQLEEFEFSESLVENPFIFLDSDISGEIKKRFGAGFYTAAANHLKSFMRGQSESLTGLSELEAWNTVYDRFTA